MKGNNKIILGCLSLFCLAACSSDDDLVAPEEPVGEPALELAEETPNLYTFSFSAEGNTTQTLQFSTNRKWSIDVAYYDENGQLMDMQDWATVFMREGKPGENIKVTVGAAENTTYDRRKAQLILKTDADAANKQLADTFYISQAEKGAVVITDKDSYKNLDYHEREIPVEFGTNMGDYIVTTSKADSAWIKQVIPSVKMTRALVSHSLFFQVAKNNSYAARTGSINITAKNNQTVKDVLPIIQMGLPKPVITVANEAAFQDLSEAAHSIKLDYTATNLSEDNQLELVVVNPADSKFVTAKATVDKTTWLNDYEITIAKNEGGARSASIILRSKANGTELKKISINQLKASDMAVDIINRNDFGAVPSDGKIGLLRYDAADVENVADIQYSVDADWVHIAKPSKGQIPVTFDKNKLLKERTATIKVWVKNDPSKYVTVPITQVASSILEVGTDYASIQDALTANGLASNTVRTLVLKGRLSKADLALLKTMATSGTLAHLDMSGVDATSEFDVCPKGQGGGYAKGQFMGCTKLEYIALPKGLKEVERNFCRNCTGLKTLIINEGTEIIHRHTFANCNALSEVYLPSTIKNIYGAAFEIKATATMNNMKMHLAGTTPFQLRYVARDPEQPRNPSYVFWGDNGPGIIYVPASALHAYKSPQPEDVVTSIPQIQDLIDACKADKNKWTTGIQTISDFIPYKGTNVTPKNMFAPRLSKFVEEPAKTLSTKRMRRR